MAQIRQFYLTITNETNLEIDILCCSGSSRLLDKTTNLGRVASGTSREIKLEENISRILAVYSGPMPELEQDYVAHFPIKVLDYAFCWQGSHVFLVIAEQDRLAMFFCFKWLQALIAQGSGHKSEAFFNSLYDPDNKYPFTTKIPDMPELYGCSFASIMAMIDWFRSMCCVWKGFYHLYQIPETSQESATLNLVAQLAIVSEPMIQTVLLSLTDRDDLLIRLLVDETGFKEEDVYASRVSLTPFWVQDGGEKRPSLNLIPTSKKIVPAIRGVVEGIPVFGMLHDTRNVSEIRKPIQKDQETQPFTGTSITLLVNFWSSCREVYLSLLEHEYLFQKHLGSCKQQLGHFFGSDGVASYHAALLLEEQHLHYQKDLTYLKGLREASADLSMYDDFEFRKILSSALQKKIRTESMRLFQNDEMVLTKDFQVRNKYKPLMSMDVS